MHANASLIDRMRQVLPDLNKAERRVAEAILADIDAAIGMTTRDLSEKAGVSEPTIVRFARRMGDSGFKDFKLRLSRDFATGRMFVMSEPSDIAADSAAIANQVYEATAQALAYSFAQRDPVALDRAAEAIHKAQRVFCMGVGGSSANVAAEAENRLYRFDVAASTIIDPYRQPVAASLCGPKDVLLIFSVTGRPASLLESARLARANGATVIAVTRPASPLAEASSVPIGLDIPDDDRRFEIPNRSRYGQLYMLDCIATLVAAKRAERVGAKLRKARDTLRHMHGNTGQQPIGD
ncbi:MurR/RpiR family transcriptional regulator [Bosea caraganae]|uniref:MurR/RpiR family transcriptional regulator n=1 Tax=Bosea caraganae TaxID=2763117 RepID=A0A370KYM7_9HYPH|nr:MurR/RpiR family transcriptional regulator [Bosea caraganae]RDJ20093.1 MurR/RpiR family transcriptional regulator [Bosea caraganae]RDJ24805.1 MurR/RpiR family transcriptional regulator [Bosea caraganae]